MFVLRKIYSVYVYIGPWSISEKVKNRICKKILAALNASTGISLTFFSWQRLLVSDHIVHQHECFHFSEPFFIIALGSICTLLSENKFSKLEALNNDRLSLSQWLFQDPDLKINYNYDDTSPCKYTDDQESFQ